MRTKSLRDQLLGLRKNRQFLAILILLFVCIIFWTGVTLITSQRSTKVSSELTKLATPINPNIDIEVIQELEQKNMYTEFELSNFTIYKIVTSRIDRIDRVVTLDTTLESVEEEINAEKENTAPSPSPDQEQSGESQSEEPSTPTSPDSVEGI